MVFSKGFNYDVVGDFLEGSLKLMFVTVTVAQLSLFISKPQALIAPLQAEALQLFRE